jgi:hypothetical protein
LGLVSGEYEPVLEQGELLRQALGIGDGPELADAGDVREHRQAATVSTKGLARRGADIEETLKKIFHKNLAGAAI